MNRRVLFLIIPFAALVTNCAGAPPSPTEDLVLQINSQVTPGATATVVTVVPEDLQFGSVRLFKCLAGLNLLAPLPPLNYLNTAG